MKCIAHQGPGILLNNLSYKLIYSSQEPPSVSFIALCSTEQDTIGSEKSHTLETVTKRLGSGAFLGWNLSKVAWSHLFMAMLCCVALLGLKGVAVACGGDQARVRNGDSIRLIVRLTHKQTEE